MNSEPAVDITVIDSVCINCHKQGKTKIYPTEIPYFKKIVIISFDCPHCNYKNSEVQGITELAPYGQIIKLNVTDESDLNRQVIKSEHATIRIEELDFEFPPYNRNGICSTVEGFIVRFIDNLTAYAQDQTDAASIEQFNIVINNLKHILDIDKNKNKTFTFIIDDPSGNSYIENYNVPNADGKISQINYIRTDEQIKAMGFKVGTDENEFKQNNEFDSYKRGADLPVNLQSSIISTWDLSKTLEGQRCNVVSIEYNCKHCNAIGVQNFCEVDIPGFRKCIIMCNSCSACGNKTSEIKASGSVSEHGKVMKLNVTSIEDLNRDILKSEYAAICIPELELELSYGTMGGFLTTLEGLLLKIAENLEDRFPFIGDSQTEDRKKKMKECIDKLKEYSKGNGLPFNFLIDDPMDMSHIGRRNSEILFLHKNMPNADKNNDEEKNLIVDIYTRNKEQNAFLGLDTMVTDHYK